MSAPGDNVNAHSADDGTSYSGRLSAGYFDDTPVPSGEDSQLIANVPVGTSRANAWVVDDVYFCRSHVEDLVAQCAGLGYPTDWAERAGTVTLPLGPHPGRAFVLMRSYDLNQMKVRGTFDALHTLTLACGSDRVTFRNLVIVPHPKCVTPGLGPKTRGDLKSTYLVEFADPRYLARNDYWANPAGSQYNVPAPDSGWVTGAGDGPLDDGELPTTAYYQGSLKDGTDVWTWQQVLDDLWRQVNVAELGTSPELPFTPDGVPNGLRFLGVPAWNAYNQVLDRLACAFAWWPDGSVYIVQRGADDSDRDLAAAGFDAEPWTPYDEEPYACTRGLVPSLAVVHFPILYEQYGQEPTTEWDDKQWSTDTPYTVITVANPNPPAVGSGDQLESGSTVILWDDLYAIVSANQSPGQPLQFENLDALTRRATERATDYFRTVSGNRFLRNYGGFIDDPGILPAGIVTAVQWRQRGQAGLSHWSGAMTSVYYTPRLLWVDRKTGMPVAPSGEDGHRDAWRPPDLARHTVPNYPVHMQPVKVLSRSSGGGGGSDCTDCTQWTFPLSGLSEDCGGNGDYALDAVFTDNWAGSLEDGSSATLSGITGGTATLLVTAGPCDAIYSGPVDGCEFDVGLQSSTGDGWPDRITLSCPGGGEGDEESSDDSPPATYWDALLTRYRTPDDSFPTDEQVWVRPANNQRLVENTIYDCRLVGQAFGRPVYETASGPLNCSPPKPLTLYKTECEEDGYNHRYMAQVVFDVVEGCLTATQTQWSPESLQGCCRCDTDCCPCPVWYVTLSGLSTACGGNGTYALTPSEGDPCVWEGELGDGSTATLTLTGGDNPQATLEFVTAGNCRATYEGAANCTQFTVQLRPGFTGATWPQELTLYCDVIPSGSSGQMCIPGRCVLCPDPPASYTIVAAGFGGTCAVFNGTWTLTPASSCLWRATKAVAGHLVSVNLVLAATDQILDFEYGDAGQPPLAFARYHTAKPLGDCCCPLYFQPDVGQSCLCGQGTTSTGCTACDDAPVTWTLTAAGFSGVAADLNGVWVLARGVPFGDYDCAWSYASADGHVSFAMGVYPDGSLTLESATDTGAGAQHSAPAGTLPIPDCCHPAVLTAGLGDGLPAGTYPSSVSVVPDCEGDGTTPACPALLVATPRCCNTPRPICDTDCPCDCNNYQVMVEGVQDPCDLANGLWCFERRGRCHWVALGNPYSTIEMTGTSVVLTITVPASDGSDSDCRAEYVGEVSGCDFLIVRFVDATGCPPNTPCNGWPVFLVLRCLPCSGAGSSGGPVSSGTTTGVQTGCCADPIPEILHGQFTYDTGGEGSPTKCADGFAMAFTYGHWTLGDGITEVNGWRGEDTLGTCGHPVRITFWCCGGLGGHGWCYDVHWPDSCGPDPAIGPAYETPYSCAPFHVRFGITVPSGCGAGGIAGEHFWLDVLAV